MHYRIVLDVGIITDGDRIPVCPHDRPEPHAHPIPQRNVTKDGRTGRDKEIGSFGRITMHNNIRC
jgi:hypothetical protein